jgi:hypothetical protein
MYAYKVIVKEAIRARGEQTDSQWERAVERIASFKSSVRIS